MQLPRFHEEAVQKTITLILIRNAQKQHIIFVIYTDTTTNNNIDFSVNLEWTFHVFFLLTGQLLFEWVSTAGRWIKGETRQI